MSGVLFTSVSTTTDFLRSLASILLDELYNFDNLGKYMGMYATARVCMSTEVP